MITDFTSVTRATDEYKTIFPVLKTSLDVATLLGVDPVSVQVSFEFEKPLGSGDVQFCGSFSCNSLP
jgi:hypothetical protein